MGRSLVIMMAAVAGLLAPACGGGGGAAPGADIPPDLAVPDATTGDVPVADAPTGDLPAEAEAPGDALAPNDAADGTADAVSDVVTAPAPHPYFDFVGEVRLEQSNDPGGGFLGSAARAFFWTAPDDFNVGLVLLEEAGACQFWVSGFPPLCEPECAPGVEYCDADGVCRPKRTRLSAGEVSFTGLLQEIHGVPDDSAWYTFEGLDADAPLFAAGASIQVSAPGAEIPGFDVEIAGVGAMIIPDPGYALVDGDDNVFAWEPQGDGAAVEVAFLTGWHGAPPPAMIWCTAPDADGALVIPQHMVEMFPPAGGMGLFPHSPWVRRVHRVIVETEPGPVEVSTMAWKNFTLTHGGVF
jgi:hypothetical protein